MCVDGEEEDGRRVLTNWRTNEQTNEQTNKRTNERTNERTIRLLNAFQKCLFLQEKLLKFPRGQRK
jgi:hypothetical protein